MASKRRTTAHLTAASLSVALILGGCASTDGGGKTHGTGIAVYNPKGAIPEVSFPEFQTSIFTGKPGATRKLYDSCKTSYYSVLGSIKKWNAGVTNGQYAQIKIGAQAFQKSARDLRTQAKKSGDASFKRMAGVLASDMDTVAGNAIARRGVSTNRMMSNANSLVKWCVNMYTAPKPAVATSKSKQASTPATTREN